MATVGEELGLPRAADYPYAAPLERFVFAADGEPPAFAVDGRTPVLALGSNAAPAQLRRKFAGHTGHIPVSRAVLLDHVVVYSAHFSRYGALPATLHRHPGAVAFVAVTWLDPEQLARMHQTEAIGVNYDYVESTDLRLEHDDDDMAAPALVGAYVSRAGALLHQGSPIRLAEVATSGCPWPALIQPAVMRFAHKRVAPELAVEEFLARLVQSETFRRSCAERLRLG
ncbi:MAG: hypothetical protein H6852_06000 [Geminicoccaceae bacterium]|jgi:hypothetical protein|nr:hypothetical protein [Geminicoccaceae bacterium]HRY25652.1 hypothetical protein [Geminicoccaceae bacterium]